MIYEHLIKGEYIYSVTDNEGRLIAETYDLGEAEQILAQYRLRQSQLYDTKHLYKGILPNIG